MNLSFKAGLSPVNSFASAAKSDLLFPCHQNSESFEEKPKLVCDNESYIRIPDMQIDKIIESLAHDATVLSSLSALRAVGLFLTHANSFDWLTLEKTSILFRKVYDQRLSPTNVDVVLTLFKVYPESLSMLISEIDIKPIQALIFSENIYYASQILRLIAGIFWGVSKMKEVLNNISSAFLPSICNVFLKGQPQLILPSLSIFIATFSKCPELIECYVNSDFTECLSSITTNSSDAVSFNAAIRLWEALTNREPCFFRQAFSSILRPLGSNSAYLSSAISFLSKASITEEKCQIFEEANFFEIIYPLFPRFTFIQRRDFLILFANLASFAPRLTSLKGVLSELIGGWVDLLEGNFSGRLFILFVRCLDSIVSERDELNKDLECRVIELMTEVVEERDPYLSHEASDLLDKITKGRKT